MKFKYISVYKIRGLTHNTATGDIQVYTREIENRSIKAILTDKPDEYCYEIDRAQVIGFSMLAGFVGQSGAGDIRTKIAAGIERLREKRQKDIEGSQVIIFIGSGETEVDFSRPSREADDYILGFDIIEKGKIVSLFADDITLTLSGLSLATERTSLEVKQVTGGVYLINEQNTPVYSMSCTVSGEAYSSFQTSDEIIREAQNNVKVISKQQLTKVNRLLIQALSLENDSLRRFMFAWASLETLIKQIFSQYEKLFVQSLLESDSTKQAGKYFERIRNVMKGKYNIVDQFLVVAACIAEETAESDIQEFIKIKKIRDNLFHDSGLIERNLPAFETISLLKKYLHRHVKFNGRIRINSKSDSNIAVHSDAPEGGA